jgi:hypothetical protein
MSQMSSTAFQFVDAVATASTSQSERTTEWIEQSLKRQARDVSDAVNARWFRELPRQITDFSAHVGHAPDLDNEPPAFHPARLRPRSNLIPLQEWEGHVIDVSKNGFSARLVDLTHQADIATEEADFDLDEVSDSDLNLLREGAVFRWTIGYETAPSGSKKRVSQLVFRRLPKWTSKEIAQADRDAETLMKGINWE